MLHTMPLPDSHAKQEANLAGAPDEDRVQAKARRRRAHQHHRSDHRASSSVGDPADIPTRSSGVDSLTGAWPPQAEVFVSPALDFGVSGFEQICAGWSLAMQRNLF